MDWSLKNEVHSVRRQLEDTAAQLEQAAEELEEAITGLGDFEACRKMRNYAREYRAAAEELRRLG